MHFNLLHKETHNRIWMIPTDPDTRPVEWSELVKGPDPKLVDTAEKIIDQLDGQFDPSTFNDRYEDALKALIKEKVKGAERLVTAEEPEEPEDTNVVDLARPPASWSSPAP